MGLKWSLLEGGENKLGPTYTLLNIFESLPIKLHSNQSCQNRKYLHTPVGVLRENIFAPAKKVHKAIADHRDHVVFYRNVPKRFNLLWSRTFCNKFLLKLKPFLKSIYGFCQFVVAL